MFIATNNPIIKPKTIDVNFITEELEEILSTHDSDEKVSI